VVREKSDIFILGGGPPRAMNLYIRGKTAPSIGPPQIPHLLQFVSKAVEG
jgi:hypothetical protein